MKSHHNFFLDSNRKLQYSVKIFEMKEELRGAKEGILCRGTEGCEIQNSLMATFIGGPTLGRVAKCTRAHMFSACILLWPQRVVAHALQERIRGVSTGDGRELSFVINTNGGANWELPFSKNIIFNFRINTHRFECTPRTNGRTNGCKNALISFAS